MLKDLSKKALKAMLALIIWVFILSLQWNGRTLFDRAHEIIIENALVEFIDQQLRVTWERVVMTAEQTTEKLWKNKTEETE